MPECKTALFVLSACSQPCVLDLVLQFHKLLNLNNLIALRKDLKAMSVDYFGVVAFRNFECHVMDVPFLVQSIRNTNI